jgi:uncharacterized protein (TIGR03032 family)
MTAESQAKEIGTAAAPAPAFEMHASRHIAAFLAAQGASLAVTTYQAGKLLLIGTKPDGSLSLFERSLPRCMGLGVFPGGLDVTTLSQLWRFRNVLDGSAPPPARYADHDALYAPRQAWVTGDCDVHDIVHGPDGRPIFANTLFSCLATVAEDASFAPLWQPRCVSRLAAEDRCHLNGIAADAEGRPRYVTLVGPSDVADGWRDHRRDGGQVIEVESGEVVATGLSMPHSPRLHDGTLYVLDSGNGQFGRIDLAAGRFEPIAFCPGYARGLGFVGGMAAIGLSLPRESGTFSGLALDAALASRGAEARCGVMLVDLRTGDAPHWLRFGGVVRELYDVAVLPGVRRPAAIGFRDGDIRHVITVGAWRDGVLGATQGTR